MSDRFDLSLRYKIAAGLVTAALVLLVGAISFWAVSRSSRASSQVERTGEVLLAQERLLSGLADSETATQGYVLTGDTTFLVPFRSAEGRVPASIARLRVLTQGNPIQQARLDTLESVAASRLRLNEQIVEFRKSSGFELARAMVATGQGMIVMDHARHITRAMENTERATLATRRAEQKASQRLVYLVIGLGSFIAFLLSVLINRAIRSDVIDREHARELIEQQSKKLKEQAAKLEKQQRELAQKLEEQEALLGSTDAGFYGLDAEGRCTFVNPAGARMLGFSPGELLGRNMHDTIHHKRTDGSPYPAGECAIYIACRTGERARTDEEVYWRKDGTPLPVEYSTSPIHGNGTLRGAVVAFADVTERKRVQRAIIESEERKAAVLRSTLDSIISMDSDGKVTEFNRAAEEAFGYTRAEALGQPLGQLVVPERFRDAHRAGLIRYLETGEAHVIGKRLELPAMRKDGSEFLSELTITRSDIDGEQAFTGVLRDITERKAAEAERELLIKALARSNQELDQFAYVASHDLKAPLRGIANLSQWIEEDLGDALAGESKGQMELLRGRVQRMESLIDGILQYSRAGRAKARPEVVDAGAIVKEAVELLAPESALRLEIMEGMPTVTTERVPLQQVFLNLIGNALKHTGKSNPLIRVEWKDAEPFFEFSVSDNGQGIAPQYHERIFGIFQTLEARDKVEGTGIGLSVVKKIVEAKGGRVWIESDVGRGATFRFLWPKHETTLE